MKQFTILIALLFALMAGAMPASAQTAITTTTLSAAITTAVPTAINITVASATDIAVNGVLFIDGSVYRVLAVTGTTIRVLNTRQPATHLTSATVYVVPPGAQLGQNPVGSCIRSTAGGVKDGYSPYTIMFNLETGDMATCRGALGSRTWYITNPYGYAPSANPPITP